jgi:hypothetical protein
MKIGKGDGSTRRKPAPAPLCPPQIPLDQTWARTWATAVGSQRLTACLSYGAGIVYPNIEYKMNLNIFLLENYIRQVMVVEFVFTDITKQYLFK